MPVPGGEITSTELWTAPAPEVAEEVVEEEVKEEDGVQVYAVNKVALDG